MRMTDSQFSSIAITSTLCYGPRNVRMAYDVFFVTTNTTTKNIVPVSPVRGPLFLKVVFSRSFCCEGFVDHIGARNTKWIAALLCCASLIGGLGLAVTGKKIDRGVFVSAQELAASCKAMKDTVGEAYALGPQQTTSTKLTTDDMLAVGRCMGYVEGVADEFRESLDSHYRPIPAGRGELPILINAFLKRVGEHPEEADLAASTVLHEADKDVLRLCGDCNFGLLVRSHR